MSLPLCAPEQMECVLNIEVKKCLPQCSGLFFENYEVEIESKMISAGLISNRAKEVKISKLSKQYWNYKGFYKFTTFGAGLIINCFFNVNLLSVEYDSKNDLRYIKIQFTTPVFDIVTKDKANKFVDMLSEIGGTMGLLTGFSIITAVEIVYFAVKIIVNFLNGILPNKKKNKSFTAKIV